MENHMDMDDETVPGTLTSDTSCSTLSPSSDTPVVPQESCVDPNEATPFVPSPRRPLVRSRSPSSDSSSSPMAFRDFRRRMKSRLQTTTSPGAVTFVVDCYSEAVMAIDHVRKKTGLAFDLNCTKHTCPWDLSYPERPERFFCIMNRIIEKGLYHSCQIIGPIVHMGLVEKLLDEVHSTTHQKTLRMASTVLTVKQQELVSGEYDAIFINQHTYACALGAVDTTLNLVQNIHLGNIHNGIAVVRPPGHHAQHGDYNGYCFFNNVAVAAKYLLNQGVKKILIVDFDVHHGQGTQQQFYDSKNVLYFSIHRYEEGTFWPNLKESNFDYIGEKDGLGYNINVPLNGTQFGDAEYMAILTHILLPVAYEFQPNFILFSAGYDACIGCPEGQMTVSPGFYGHMIKLLSGLAKGKLAVLLEGGYFAPSLAEGAVMTLEALMDGRPAKLPSLGRPNYVVADTINDLKFILHRHWLCFNVFGLNTLVEGDDAIHRVRLNYMGKMDPGPYPTRNCYPAIDLRERFRFQMLVDSYRSSYGAYRKNKVCYTFDNDVCLHTNPTGDFLPENVDRVIAIMEYLKETGLLERCEKIPITQLLHPQFITDTHDANYFDKLFSENYKPDDRKDLYWNHPGSKKAILAAVNSLMLVCKAVITGKYSSGVAIIRPPGHHAENDHPEGFCFVNNVAVAASYLYQYLNVPRILIVDFDIHHGNGTQKAFYEVDNVLYMSIHKHENGNFFPKGTDGKFHKTGSGEGEGFNINIPFSNATMGDTEYLTTFFRIILPVAYEYTPDVIIVSAGFDAGINDLLGNYKVSPQAFAHMIQLLRPLAKGRIILALEGGYNITTLKHSMALCVKALLGDPLPKLCIEKPLLQAHESIQAVVNLQKTYWGSLNVDKPLPDRVTRVVNRAQ